MTDAQVFVDSLYGRDIVNNRHFTVTEDTGVVNEEICSDKIFYAPRKLKIFLLFYVFME